MISISLCMIVKNEENILARCLDSIHELMDEIIIIDTGSTDHTKTIASKYTDKIYDFHWNNDFSAARNFSFSKATKEYIYVADADEILDSDNAKRFQQLKEILLPEIEIVQMKYITSTEFNTVYNCEKEYRPKLFKRLRSFQWISPIHETIELDPVVFDSEIEILHCPQTHHSKRDFSTFIKAIEHKTFLHKHALIMFCKELFISGDLEDFIKVKDIFEQVLSKEQRSQEEFKNISCVLAHIYRVTQDTNNFFKVCLKEMASNPSSEICFELGEYFYEIKDYEEAILWFINASSETESIIDIRTSGIFPLNRLADCYLELSKKALQDQNKELYDIYLNNSNLYKQQAKDWKLPVEL